MVAMIDSPNWIRVAPALSNKSTRSRKPSYKAQLAEKHARYSDTINALEGNLKKKVDQYYQALSGQYTYTDTHTGKIVQARTYKKRMEFAQEKLKDLEQTVAVHLRYGKMNEEQARSLMIHTRNLYNTAIRDNEYLKDKNTRKSAAAHNLRSQIQSLEYKLATAPQDVEDLNKTMRTPTGYTNFLLETISTPIPEPTQPVPAQERKTSSSLLNRFAEIDAQRSNVKQDDGKIPDGAQLVWPHERKHPLDLEDVLKFAGKTLLVGLTIATLGIGAAIYKGKITWGKTYESPIALQTENRIDYSLPEQQRSPFVTGESFYQNPPVEKALEVKSITPAPVPIVQSREVVRDIDKLPASELTPAEYEARQKKRLEEQLARARAVYQRIVEQHPEKPKPVETMPAIASKPLEHPVFNRLQEQAPVVQQKELPSAKELMLKIWERRSHERKARENLVVVKEVLYNGAKEPIVTYPNKAYNEYIAASQD